MRTVWRALAILIALIGVGFMGVACWMDPNMLGDNEPGQAPRR